VRSPGISDEEVVRIARAETRLIVTFDRDYGKLVFRRGLPAPAGILYLRFFPNVPEEVAAYALRLIEDGIALEGRFTTADRGGTRQFLLRSAGESNRTECRHSARSGNTSG